MTAPQILPDVKLTIVHPDTKIPCAHTDLGEVGVTKCSMLLFMYVLCVMKVQLLCMLCIKKTLVCIHGTNQSNEVRYNQGAIIIDLGEQSSQWQWLLRAQG